jgi:hypothetical protein
MLSESITGLVSRSDGTTGPMRADKTGATVVSDGHGKYTEPALRNTIYSLDSDSVTLAAANATKGALGTVKLVNGIYNPPGSGKNIVILGIKTATVSGTPAGPLFLNYLCAVALSNAATGTVRSTFLSASNAQSVAVPQVNVVLASNTPAATTALIQLETVGGPAAIAAGAGVNSTCEDVAGRIIVPPGCVFGITATGAGTTHVVQSTIIWEEVPA